MNIAEIAIKKRVITWTLTLLLPVMGYLAYRGLPRLEDPEFAIKQAVVLTPYPGASAREVEAEVTEKIEKAVQQLGQLKRVESYSERGLSRVKVVIKDNYDLERLPQVWDELRRKVQDHQLALPPGAGPSMVMDDFGDTYGVYFALTGQGFTMAEFKRVAELLKRELTTVTDVKKVVFFGVRGETIQVEMSKTKVKALGITLPEIVDALAVKNLPADAGRIKIGSEFMPIVPSGVFQSEKDFADLLVGSQGGKLIYLKDVAAIHRGYEDPPQAILRVDGQPAVGIAISTVQGGNAVEMGRAVNQRVQELLSQIPLGMDLVMISDQAASVVKAIDGFIVNLIEAVAIVILVLLFFMGLRSGLIIGFILVLTIAATFMVMGYFNITLERISLGALIIALGMLVDNAIVVVDGMKVRMQQGVDGLQAAREVVGQNAVPLLGATAVAILAFAAIGGMDNDTGEYCRALYYVILISLSLSWLTAVTSTPLLVTTFIKPKQNNAAAGQTPPANPYNGKIYKTYRRLLTTAIRYRWITIGVVLVLFVAALIGFGFVKNLFFPPSTRPQFLIETQFREGIHILEAERKVAKIEKLLKSTEGVTTVASAIGDGHPRFLLTYDVPIDTGPHYSAILVSVSDYKVIDRIYQPLQQKLETLFPDATINVKKFNVGPGNGGKIQLRINGPDPVELRRMADRVKAIIAADPDSKAIRHEWGAKVKTIQPVLAEDRARRAGIDRRMAAMAFQTNYTGLPAGVYREGTELIPIYVRAPAGERKTVEEMGNIPLISPITGDKIPALQIIDGLRTGFEDARLSRYNRRSMIKVHADARTGLPSDLLTRVKPKIEQALGVDTQAYSGRYVPPGSYTAGAIPIRYDDIIPLKDKPGYFIAWSGEAEDSAEATAQLGGSIPIFFGLMILTVIFLFNAFRQPLIIWLTVPLSIIGVTVGLLLFHQPFGFMALLGVMSLAGMLIKNAIVLVDQIEMEIRAGKPRLQAVVDSGVSRMMPVCMAAITTIMGMAPLLQDDFFVSMAVSIMFGLGFATLLTLIVVPVLYVIFFRIPYEANALAAKGGGDMCMNTQTKNPTRAAHAILLLFCVCLLSGCAVGPDYVRPSAPDWPEWSTADSPAIRSEAGDLGRWWQVFHDPLLDRLIETACQENLDLHIAGLRILESRAQLGIAVGGLYPQQQVIRGGYTHTGLSKHTANTQPGMDMNYGEASLGFDAAWELDLWGKFRRAVEAGRATLDVSVAQYDDILVTLTAEVARTYILIRTLGARLAIARENAAIQKRSLQVAQARFQGGEVSELDVSQAKALLNETLAAVPRLQSGLKQARNGLAILLGMLPGQVDAVLTLHEPGTIPQAPGEIAVGAPAQLLRRRPDIRLAERRLAAQCALIGIAKADLYPSFSLFGTIGLRASDAELTFADFPKRSDLGDLWRSDSVEFMGGPSFSWNIFNYGRIKNNVRVQDARFQQLAVDYRNTVLKAAQEVEDAMAAFLMAHEELGHLSESLAAAMRSVELSTVQYREGLVDFQRVLDTQRFQTQVQDLLTSTQGAVALHLIATYKALGGGWEIRSGKDFVSEDIKHEMRTRTDWGHLLAPAK